MSVYIQLITLILTVVAGALWHERRMTKIETLLSNHLQHHQEFITPILKKLADRL